MTTVNRFTINTTRVDIDRCRLYCNDKEIALEPRVIQVLHFLAQHQGQVVSHQTLQQAIWKNTVVEASALQRCIAQLRKAFGDDARQQAVIATYPKRGYSLVAEVNWDNPSAVTHNKSRQPRSAALAASLVLAFVLGIGGIALLPAENTTDPVDESAAGTDLAALASNPSLVAAIGTPDDFPVYSPDGRYVVYPRYLDENKANLWARDLAYGNDFLLTEEAGKFEHLAWSRDSSQLVFVDSSCQVLDCEAGQCSALKSVTISQSETNILSVQKLIDCSPVQLLAPEWLNNRQLVVIELEAGTATLKQYDLKSRERSTLYESQSLVPYHLSFSRQTDILTIMAINPAGIKELLFMDIRTGSLNRTGTAAFVPETTWYPSAAPL